MSDIIKRIRKEMKGVTHCFKDVSLKKKGDNYHLQFTTPSFSVPTSAGDLEMGEFKLDVKFADTGYVHITRGKSVNFKGESVHPNLAPRYGRRQHELRAFCVGVEAYNSLDQLLGVGLDAVAAMYFLYDILVYCDRGPESFGYTTIVNSVQYKEKFGG